jgi:CRP-like cAMP-binding protein
MAKKADEPWLLEDYLTTNGDGRLLREVRKGEKLFRKGDPATHIFRVYRGLLKLIWPDNSRANEIIYPSYWLFEHATELGHHHMQTASGVVDSLVMEFEHKMFLKTLSERPQLGLRFYEDMGLRQTESLHGFDQTPQRVARCLQKLCGKDDVKIIEFGPAGIGVLIGRARQTTSPVMRDFVERGIVEHLSPRRYRIHRKQLERFLGERE